MKILALLLALLFAPAQAQTNLTPPFGFSDETTWTPVLAFGGASVGITYTAQSGIISRAGNGQNSAFFFIVLSSKGSSTGAATITGLPVGERAGFYGDCNISYYSVMAGVSAIKPYIAASTSVITLAVPSATDNNNSLLDTNFSATTALVGHCSYAS